MTLLCTSACCVGRVILVLFIIFLPSRRSVVCRVAICCSSADEDGSRVAENKAMFFFRTLRLEYEIGEIDVTFQLVGSRCLAGWNRVLGSKGLIYLGWTFLFELR